MSKQLIFVLNRSQRPSAVVTVQSGSKTQDRQPRQLSVSCAAIPCSHYMCAKASSSAATVMKTRRREKVAPA